MIDLSLLKRKTTTALIIRHADRNLNMSGKIEQLLTQGGRKRAFKLGNSVKGFNHYFFYSSAFARCKETCTFIGNGLCQSSIEINTLISLGDPGCFVLNSEQNAFSEMPLYSVIEKQIKNEPLKGIRNIEEGTKIFLNDILEKLFNTPDNSLLVFVTHDAIIAPIIFMLTGEIFKKEHWIGFVDGFLVEKEKRKITVIRNKKKFPLRNIFINNNSDAREDFDGL